MNQHLQTILNFIQQSEHLSDEEKTALSKSAKDAAKELEITSFKLDRTEKVKRTTAILLEETIEELEQKRKAVEAQNQELEIEASLERVRSRSLSMHKSDELNEVVTVLFEKFKELKIPVTAAGIHIYIAGSKDVNVYICGQGENDLVINNYRLPYFEHIIWNDLNNAREKQLDFFVGNYSREEKNSFYRYVFEHSALAYLPDDIKSLILESPAYTISLVPTKNSMFAINDFEGKMLSENETDIIKRFSKVFEQAYVRFLDLQKAEAQAKEAQIQLALERVRARTMAMHQSNELADTTSVLFQQIKELGFETWSCGFCIWTKNDLAEVWMAADSGGLLPPMMIPYKEEPTHAEIYQASLRGEPAHDKIWEGKELEKHYDFLQTIPSVKTAIEQLKKAGLSLPSKQCYYVGFFKEGYLLLITKEPNEDLKDLSKRFASVFDLTYTRFLDLQKAEAQAREAQIQLALERVRARTMAMQHSDELSETASEMFRQIQLLGLKTWSCGFNIIDKENCLIIQWVSTGDGRILPAFVTPSDEDVFQRFTQAAEKDKSFYVEEMGGEVLKAHYQYMASLPGVKKLLDEFQSLEITPPDFQVFHLASFSYGYLMFITYQPAPEFYDVFKRFATVFDQTYRRFLDLQKAEAQARESQIEVALERVRSRSMGMQKSEELKEVIQIVYQQMTHLNIYLDHAGFVVDYIPKGNWHFWIADEQDIPAEITHPYFESVWATQFNEAKEKGTNFFVTHLNFEEKNKFYNELLSYVPGLPEASKDFYLSRPGLAATTVLFDNVSLYIENFEGIPYSDEDNKTLIRFGKVFQQTYTRFNDLKKAEAQAREARIEAALEKVRSRSLAMHKSDELQDVVNTVFDRLKALKIDMNVASIFIFAEDSKDWEQWVASSDTNYSTYFHLPYTDNAIFRDLEEAKQSGKDFYSVQYSNEEKNKWFSYAFANTEYSRIPDNRKQFLLESEFYQVSFALSKHIGLQLAKYSGEDFSENNNEILIRFAKVFEQAYVRFLDLQKAEAQSRESQIELSLERVRAKTMAMHNSADVGETAAVMVEELKKLDIETIRCGIGIMHEPGDMEVWTISTDENNKTDIIIGWLDMNMHPLLHGAFESWRNKIDTYAYELINEDLLSYYNAINNYPGYPIKYDTANLPKQIHHNEFHFTEGTLFAFSLQQLTDEQRKIFKRFAGLFGQTYRRYLDLKKAETQAKEAQIETALERVRSRTLAMQKSDELAETSAVLFQQLIGLGISPNRLYISIMKDDVGNTEFWITDEDGSKVSMAYEDNLNNNSSFKKMYEGWKEQKKSLVIDMKGKALKEYLNHLTSIHVPFKGGLAQKRRLQYIAYFSKGFIGMAAPDEQPEETLQLLERFAYVFNLTFTRFNDLQIAEAHAVQAEQDLIEIKAARKKAEETLVELQSTQKQLVQSEKMASLGELTAGIAHEIQNPLNFVNNFSEVSKELLDEMKAALESGNKDEADEIVNDIIQNLEKINHHGKRADAIVKGMLQHSRSSTSNKEQTNINALCDEYIRFCYHGLRSKDNSFNATIKTDFDNSIGKINIVPQDISRVILNILTNAFYAVNQRSQQSIVNSPQPLSNEYKPIVSVSTKKLSDKIEIVISDNGNGIPQNIIDKIFQPFFTTKPTGQGTGLGLSLSYDIVKAHGGEIKVETKEGEGTTFIIQLPI